MSNCFLISRFAETIGRLMSIKIVAFTSLGGRERLMFSCCSTSGQIMTLQFSTDNANVHLIFQQIKTLLASNMSFQAISHCSKGPSGGF